MNHHTKAKIAARRRAAEWVAQTAASFSHRPADHKAMVDLGEELRSAAAHMETAEPNPRRRQLVARRERMKDLIGRKVRLLRTIRTRGNQEFPAGSVMTIEGHWRGMVHLADGWWYPYHAPGTPKPRRMKRELANARNISGTAGYVRRVDMHGLELIPQCPECGGEHTASECDAD